jgi:hypothetical protein
MPLLSSVRPVKSATGKRRRLSGLLHDVHQRHTLRVRNEAILEFDRDDRNEKWQLDATSPTSSEFRRSAHS